MVPRSQLEAQIASSLARLSPEDLQRVAEDYARIRFPDRFPRFDFRAFSPEGRSRPGWPDAWVCLDDRIDGVEATGDKSKSRVQDHFQEDVEKAIARHPPLAGLILVSGCPTVHLSQDEILTLRQRFITDAGIEPDRLHLIIGGGLVEELAHPEFIRTRIEVLGIPEAPAHFKLVRPRRGPDESRLNSDFIPSEEDYAKHRVHRPAAADDVLTHLRREGRALVRGVGASGKTVLAWLLALEAAEELRPSYYLDLADYAEVGPEIANALIADLQSFAHSGSLFVLDNCHLNETLAKEVVLEWEDLYREQRPLLLLVGRELRTARGSAIEGLSLSTIPLRARQPELLGVYRRLAARHHETGTPPEPPSTVLEYWVHTFGGDPANPETTTDLIAFSAAVTRRLPDLLRSDWSLRVSDAVEEVRETYLQKLSEEETNNLIRLAACEEIELALAHEALANRSVGLRNATRRLGLVFRDQVGASRQFVRYRLAHAALGNLILAATEKPVDAQLERREAALRYPHLGGAMLGRLLSLGLTSEGQEIARAMLTRPQSLFEIGPLQYLYNFFRRVQSLDIALPRDVGERLADSMNRDKLTELALRTPLGSLATFLSYSARMKTLRPIFDTLAEGLSAPGNRGKMAERALQTPLESLATFLRYSARIKTLRPVLEALAEDLSLSENRRKLAERALQTPLENLAHFLSYLEKTKDFRPVFESLAEDLSAVENRRKLAEQALQTTLGGLAHFLGHTARIKTLNSVFETLSEDLSAPENRGKLAERALQTPLEDLAHFLGFVEKTEDLRPVFETLVESLSTPENRGNLAKRALQTPFESLANFLSYAAGTKTLRAVFETLVEGLSAPENRGELTERALRTPLEGLASFFIYAARTKTLRPVFETLTEGISAPKNRGKLLDRALQTPLENLAHFLGSVEKTKDLRPVFETLAESLSAPENRGKLAERALQTPLENLAHFLGYAANSRELKRISDDLVADLSVPENVRTLAKTMAGERLDALVAVLRADVAKGLWRTVFAEIDEELWNDARLFEPKPNLDAFVALQRIAVQQNRSELVRVPAYRVVIASTTQDWHRPGIALHHLSHTVRLATDASESEIDAFVKSIATPRWLDGLIESATPGALAGSLLGLASALGVRRLGWLRRPSLEIRIKREFLSIGKTDAQEGAQSLAFVGSAAAIGMSLRTVSARWPSKEHLAEMLRLRIPDPDRTSILPMQVQFWLGLREMARLRRDSPQVPPELADSILDLWISTDQEEVGRLLPSHVRALNAEMISWLTQCKAAGWRLVPPGKASPIG